MLGHWSQLHQEPIGPDTEADCDGLWGYHQLDSDVTRRDSKARLSTDLTCNFSGSFDYSSPLSSSTHFILTSLHKKQHQWCLSEHQRRVCFCMHACFMFQVQPGKFHSVALKCSVPYRSNICTFNCNILLNYYYFYSNVQYTFFM